MEITPLTPVLLLFTGFGAFVCVWACRRWLRQLRGEPQKTLTHVSIPWPVWPLAIFSGLMCIAAALPGLLGQPLWLLEQVFALIRRVA